MLSILFKLFVSLLIVMITNALMTSYENSFKKKINIVTRIITLVSLFGAIFTGALLYGFVTLAIVSFIIILITFCWFAL